MPWYRDRAGLRLILLAYAPWLAGLNLVWETAQLPLYMIWTEGTPSYIAFAVAHCTAADVLVGVSALALVLILGAERELARWHWRRIAAGTAFAGVVFTAFSEWLNTRVLGNWAYSKLMPTLEMAGVEIGASPLVQWILLPPLALYLARRAAREPHGAGAV